MILLANGPNLNLLGEGGSQPEGSTTLGEIERMVSEHVPEDQINALAARLPPLFKERARRMH